MNKTEDAGFILLGIFSFLIGLFLVQGLTGCSKRQYPVVITNTTETKDSSASETKIIYKDTIIKMPGDSVRITDTFLVPCPGLAYTKKVTSPSGRTSAEINIKGNRLQVDCKTDSLQLVIDSLATVISTQKFWHSQVITRWHQLPPIKINRWYIPWWIWLLLAGTLMYWGYQLRKKIFLL